MYIRKLFKNLPKKYQLHKFNNLSLYSRKCKQGDIFFSIKGAKKNGNKFIKNAIKNGAKTIISDIKHEGYRKNILFLHSLNTRKLLSVTASRIYNKKPKNLIAITGTNGK